MHCTGVIVPLTVPLFPYAFGRGVINDIAVDVAVIVVGSCSIGVQCAAVGVRDVCDGHMGRHEGWTGDGCTSWLERAAASGCDRDRRFADDGLRGWVEKMQ